MRIVAGTLRGRAIDAPSGEDTRPTTDRVREALFSSLYSLRGGFEGAVVLDAFAGTGALGIEALSRGANRAVFYEAADAAYATLKRNLASCGLGPASAAAFKRNVLASPPGGSQGVFDLVFLDPPYAYDPAEVLAMLRAMEKTGALADGAIVVYEHALKAKDAVAGAFAECGIEAAASKKYGKTGVTTGIIARS